MTLNQIIYDIRGIIRDAKSDDLHFTDRQIAFWIQTLRSKLLKERLDRGQTISSNNYQTLNNIEVNLEQPYTGIQLGVDVDCPVLKTGLIPNIIEHNGAPLISNIRGLNIYSKITILPKAQAIRQKNRKYAKHSSVAFMEDNHIYILGENSYIENISLEAIFEDPNDASKYNTGEMFDFNAKYPMDSNIVDTMQELIISRKLSVYFQLPEDKQNDAETAY